jgi:hypothetical protein
VSKPEFRSLQVEHIIAVFPKQCRHCKYETESGPALILHEDQCEYRSVPCHYSSCKGSVLLSQLEKHAVSVHRANKWEIGDGDCTVTIDLYDYAVGDKRFLSYNRQLFFPILLLEDDTFFVLLKTSTVDVESKIEASLCSKEGGGGGTCHVGKAFGVEMTQDNIVQELHNMLTFTGGQARESLSKDGAGESVLRVTLNIKMDYQSCVQKNPKAQDGEEEDCQHID